MKCMFCLKEINDDLIFCPYCGRKTVVPDSGHTGYAPEFENSNYNVGEPSFEASQSPKQEYQPHDPREEYPSQGQRTEYPSYNQRDEYPHRGQNQEYRSQYDDSEDDMVYYEDEFDDYTQDNDDALYYEKKSPMYNGYRNRNSRRKNSNNVWLIVLAVVLALAVAGITCWLLFLSFADKPADNDVDNNSGSSETVYSCSICKKDMTTNAKYCDDCIEDYTCEICEQVSKDTKGGYCADCSVEYKCRTCNKIDESVSDGYCSDCFSELKCKASGCNNVIKSGYYCSSCVKSYASDSSNIKCNVCNEKIDVSAVYLIDTKGRLYCKDCDTGRYCSKCFGYLTGDSSSDVCSSCVQYNCAKCGKTLAESEIVVMDNKGRPYCDNCDTGFYCETCSAPIKNNETKCKNCSEVND